MNPKIETKSAHTPTPWSKGIPYVDKESGLTFQNIVGNIPGSTNGKFIAMVLSGTPETENNVDVICLAVNNFKEMREALEILKADMEQHYRDDNGDVDHDGIEFAESILTRIREQEEGKC